MATAKKTIIVKGKTKDEAVPKESEVEVDLAIVENIEADDDIDGSEEKVANPNVVKKKEVYDHVSVSTGLRKRDVREAVDSMLEYMHMCLSDGKDMQLPPLGKIKSIERGQDDNIKLHYKVILKKIDETEKKDD